MTFKQYRYGHQIYQPGSFYEGSDDWGMVHQGNTSRILPHAVFCETEIGKNMHVPSVKSQRKSGSD